jgi:hypothetical protein
MEARACISLILTSLYGGKRSSPLSGCFTLCTYCMGGGGGKICVYAGIEPGLSIPRPVAFRSCPQFVPKILRSRWSCACPHHEGIWGRLASGTDGAERSALRPGRCTSPPPPPRRKNPSYLLNGNLVGLQSRSGRFGQRKSPALVGNRIMVPRTSGL